MLLSGKDVQTDFKLNVPGAPPIGKRQPTPLDGNLAIAFISPTRINCFRSRPAI